MTDQLAALAALAVNPGEARDTALAEFYEQWKGDGLVMNKWLGIQAASSLPGQRAGIVAGAHGWRGRGESRAPGV